VSLPYFYEGFVARRKREGGRRVCYKKREMEIYGEVVCMEKSFGYNHRERNKYKENKEIKKRKLKNIFFFNQREFYKSSKHFQNARD
jgi:hypothetical protein